MIDGLNKALEIVEKTIREYEGTSAEAGALLRVKERLEVYTNEEIELMAKTMPAPTCGDCGRAYKVGLAHRCPVPEDGRCPRCESKNLRKAADLEECTVSYWCAEEKCGWATLSDLVIRTHTGSKKDCDHSRPVPDCTSCSDAGLESGYPKEEA